MTYRDILFHKEAGPLLLAINLGRLAAGLIPFGLIAFYSSRHEYAFAGAASSVLMLTGALTAPYKGRIITRYSPIVTVVPMAFTSVFFTTIGFLTSYVGRPFYLAMVLMAFGTILSPPSPALVRTLWTRIANNSSFNRALHSLDSITEELTFAIAPLVTTAIWATVGAVWAIPIGLAFSLIGNIAIILLAGRKNAVTRDIVVQPISKPAEPVVTPKTLANHSIYFKRASIGILFPMIGLGVSMGALGILFPQWAELYAGSQSASGIFLSIISFSGALFGFLFGKTQTQLLTPVVSYRIAALTVTTGVALVSLSSGIFLAVLGAIIMGAGMTTMFIASFLLICDNYSAYQQTEMNAAVGSSFDIGSGIASFLAGYLASHFGLHVSLDAIFPIVLVLSLGTFVIKQHTRVHSER